MLIPRILTAIVLLAVLLPVLLTHNGPAFAIVATLFFGAAMWEAARLFGQRLPPLYAGIWTFLFVYSEFGAANGFEASTALFALCVALWVVRFTPSLAIGLPVTGNQPGRRALGNTLLCTAFTVALFGCFIGIVELYKHSAVYLLSVLVLVWIADIGAYFSGKAFGKHKLAPSISPGKSWEGAIGGGIAVLLLASLTVPLAASTPWLRDTFVVQLQASRGWLITLALLVLLVAASIVGDLFESQLKRRAGMKDSSALLPGHGGVLDRIDALVPVVPLAALVSIWI